MKPTRQSFEIFSLSFLDIISSAFGAVVMLVLLAKNGDIIEVESVENISEQIQRVSQLESKNQQLNEMLKGMKVNFNQIKSQSKMVSSKNKILGREISNEKQKALQLESSISGLEIVKSSQHKAALKSAISKKREQEVGGIPVDSEYIIFIVDTSGSMLRIWPRLLSEMEKILDIHPKVKGFQVMNDMGSYLISSTSGKWIKDSSRIRKAVLDAMRNWMSLSNSSPVEGLEVALKTYAKTTPSLSIYILGDDYSGGSYDPVIKMLNRLNTDKKTGKRIARVHAIGFITGQNITRFSTLMREVTRQNRGTFLALPK